MKKDNNKILNEIENLPLVVESKKVELSDKFREVLNKSTWKKVSENSKKVDVYRIIYKSKGSKVMGFLVLPKNVRTKLPCIIYNRGGSRDFASLKMGHLFYNMANFAKEGYVAIASNYAGSPGSEGVDDWGGDTLNDILVLKKILKAFSKSNDEIIGMYGWSRGATMTYMCLAKVKWIKAAVVGAGSADEVSAAKLSKKWRTHQISLYGKSKKEQIKRSALYWTNKFCKKTPLLIMHGTADKRVDPRDSVRLAGKLYENKVPFRLVMFEGGDHSLTEYREEVLDLELKWFKRYLKKGIE